MSAWIVSKKHIDYLVSAMAQYGTLDSNAHYVGQKLWQENVTSVAHRYPDDTPAERPGPVYNRGVRPSTYKHVPYKKAIEPIALLKQIGCYQYQSCEHDGWKDSWSYRAMKDLETRVLSTLPEDLQAPVQARYDMTGTIPRAYQCDQYDAAPWGID